MFENANEAGMGRLQPGSDGSADAVDASGDAVFRPALPVSREASRKRADSRRVQFPCPDPGELEIGQDER